jgi:hypothetical protein
MTVSLNARILLGWFDRESAVRALMTGCVHDGLTAADAEAIWRPFHERVQRLPERPPQMPVRHPLRTAERAEVTDFLRRARQFDRCIEVVKIDPMLLAVRQLMVVDELASRYQERVRSDHGWRTTCLPRPVPRRSLRPRAEGADTVIDLPHAEFQVLETADGALKLVELQPWVMVGPLEGRMVLWAGYHRAFARMVQMDLAPQATVDRAVPVVLTSRLSGAANTARLTVATGLRPPLFRDFFDQNLFFMVRLRKKRYEIRATSNGDEITVCMMEHYV